MNSPDQQVLSKLIEWLSNGENCWLATIVETIGSYPRPIGSLMAFNNVGSQAGSISGGCVEEDLISRVATGEIQKNYLAIHEFGITADQNEKLGLPCGGTIKVLVQGLDSTKDITWITETAQGLSERICITRELDLKSKMTRLVSSANYQPFKMKNDKLIQSFGPRMRMFLVGAGQLSQCLADIALALDYEVFVVDPRADAIKDWSGPSVTLLQGMPDDILREKVDSKSTVITLTHDPRIDDMALCEALEGPAWYVGALGSQRTTKERLKRLKSLGISKQLRDKLHAPVGLDIGSKMPMEIAVAIIGELTQLRRSGEFYGQ
ncbi:MAG: hypothetical protein CBE15_07190 [Euryarchaeota archaeon TMED255]|nr:MAG: hypothetical protein CBE15_07190 [Euryarchaeota archaeon TMED255]